MRRIIALLVVGLPSWSAFGEFVPGRLYVSVNPLEGFPDQPNARVYEFNPQTGQSRVFAEIPDSIDARLTGLCFSPDGSTLFGSLFQSNTIAAISSDGSVSAAYGPADGIAGPAGSNNLDFDEQGRFYVSNFFNGSILRFPIGGGTPEVLITEVDVEPIAVTSSEQVYFASEGSTTLRRLDADGIPVTFDTLPGGITSMTADSQNNLFISDNGGLSNRLWRYSNNDPTTRTLITDSIFSDSRQAIALSPDESALYVTAGRRIFSVASADGETLQIGEIGPGYPALVGDGLAVYVPEPSSIATLVTLFAFAFSVRR